METDEPTTTAALRSGDRHLVERVQRLCALAGLDLTVVAPGGEPPAHGVLLDDLTESTGRPWHELGRAVIDLGAPGLCLPEDAETVLARLVAQAAPRRARLVGVVGASGGLGSSALAAALARVAVVAGRTCTLVDLDPAGGGLDVLLGIEHDPGPRWADVRGEHGGFPPDRLMSALPQWHGVRVLSGDVRGGAGGPGGAQAVDLDAVSALARAADVIVLDLPRSVLARPGDHDQLTWCADVVLLAGCTTRAAAAAAAAMPVLAGHTVHLVVRGPGVGALRPADVADTCGLPLAAVLRPERAFAAGLERGLSPGDQSRGPLLATARRLARTLELAR